LYFNVVRLTVCAEIVAVADQRPDAFAFFSVVGGNATGSVGARAADTDAERLAASAGVVAALSVIAVLIAGAADVDTTHQRITLRAGGTDASREVLAHLAGGTITARHAGTRVRAFAVEASEVFGAVVVNQTLVAEANVVRISRPADGTRANRSVACGSADGLASARLEGSLAWIDALSVQTLSVIGAIVVALAFSFNNCKKTGCLAQTLRALISYEDVDHKDSYSYNDHTGFIYLLLYLFNTRMNKWFILFFLLGSQPL
jgi:hypothetical protein